MMTYMENAHKSCSVQEKTDEGWETVEENIGLGGYLAFQKLQGDNPNYRVIDRDGYVIWENGKRKSVSNR